MKNLTLDEIKHAFSIMGEFLRDKKTLGEIAVYGGGAILLQFRWRGSTRDIDATVISDGNHGLVRQAADLAATELGMERSWLSEAVSHYTSAAVLRRVWLFRPLSRSLVGPDCEWPSAKPEYLLAMELAALQRQQPRTEISRTRDGRPWNWASRPSMIWRRSYRAFFPEESPQRAKLRLPEPERDQEGP